MLIGGGDEVDVGLQERVVRREGKHDLCKLEPEAVPRRLPEDEELEGGRDAHADGERGDGVACARNTVSDMARGLERGQGQLTKAQSRAVERACLARRVVEDVLLQADAAEARHEQQALGVLGRVAQELVRREGEPQ